MATYEFQCQRCGKRFERVWSVVDYERQLRKKIKCPGCGSSKITQQISSFQLKTSKKS